MFRVCAVLGCILNSPIWSPPLEGPVQHVESAFGQSSCLGPCKVVWGVLAFRAGHANQLSASFAGEIRNKVSAWN